MYTSDFDKLKSTLVSAFASLPPIDINHTIKQYNDMASMLAKALKPMLNADDLIESYKAILAPLSELFNTDYKFRMNKLSEQLQSLTQLEIRDNEEDYAEQINPIVEDFVQNSSNTLDSFDNLDFPSESKGNINALKNEIKAKERWSRAETLKLLGTIITTILALSTIIFGIYDRINASDSPNEVETTYKNVSIYVDNITIIGEVITELTDLAEKLQNTIPPENSPTTIQRKKDPTTNDEVSAMAAE